MAPLQGILEEVKLITWPNPLQVSTTSHLLHTWCLRLLMTPDLLPRAQAMMCVLLHSGVNVLRILLWVFLDLKALQA